MLFVAWELVRNEDAWMHLSRVTKADNARALKLLEEDLVRVPGREAVVLGDIVQVYLQRLHMGWAEEPAEVIAEMRRSAMLCLDRYPRLLFCHQAAAEVYAVSGEGDKMVASWETTFELSGLYAHQVWLARALAIATRPDEAMAQLEQARPLVPDEFASQIIEVTAEAHFAAGRTTRPLTGRSGGSTSHRALRLWRIPTRSWQPATRTSTGLKTPEMHWSPRTSYVPSSVPTGFGSGTQQPRTSIASDTWTACAWLDWKTRS